MRNLGDTSSTITAKYCREDSLNEYEGVVLKSDLVGEFTVGRSGVDEYLINGTVSGVQEFECSRTLVKFEEKFAVQIKILVKKSQSAEETELDNEDEELFIVTINSFDDEVDISECIRQQIVLHQPINPVKDPDKDFKWEADVPQEKSNKDTVDSRWSELEKLKQKFKKDNL
ncbi:MAG: DUF177 domain-containing protein [Fibrobacterales bacterium]